MDVDVSKIFVLMGLTMLTLVSSMSVWLNLMPGDGQQGRLSVAENGRIYLFGWVRRSTTNLCSLHIYYIHSAE